MNKNIVFATAFAGAAVGAYFIARWFQKKDGESVEEVVEDIPETVEEDADDGVISFAGEEGFGIEIEPETEEDIPEEAGSGEDAPEEAEEGTDDDPKEFELIGQSEFDTTELDFFKYRFTYFMEGETLVDDDEDLEMDIEKTIGHDAIELLVNNPYSNVLYLRYPHLGADFEVKLDSGSFPVGGTD